MPAGSVNNTKRRGIMETLRKIPLFSGLGDEQLVHLGSVLKWKEYLPGSVILAEGEPGNNLFILLNGSAKVTRAGGQGREVVIAFIRAGEFFGELSILDGHPRSASVVALDDSQVYVIERSDFIGLIRRDPDMSIHILQELARRIRASDRQIEYLALNDAESRVFHSLIRVAEDIGIQDDGSDVLIARLPTQQDLADMAGTSRETVSRVLRRLESKGMISRSDRHVKLHNLDQFHGWSGRPIEVRPVKAAAPSLASRT